MNKHASRGRSSLLKACAAIDQQITVDVNLGGFIQDMWRKTRSRNHYPLVYSAGRTLDRALNDRNRTILLLGGFPMPHPFGKSKDEVHTDGIVGIASLVRVLVGMIGMNVVFVADEGLGGVAQSCFEAAFDISNHGTRGRRRVTIVELPIGMDVRNSCEEIIMKHNPAFVLSSEKPSANARGRYHSASGQDMTPYVARSDSLLHLASKAHIPTIAVGDIGNEAGMGLIKDIIARTLPKGGRCHCGCEGTIIAATPANHVVLGTMSDWGIYGILSYLAMIRNDISIIPTEEEISTILESVAQFMQLSGGKNSLMTDGISLSCTSSCVGILRNIVSN